MVSNGQWFGMVGGDVPGIAVLELDERGGRLDGIAYHFPTDPAVPSVAAHLKDLDPTVTRHRLSVPLLGVDPIAGLWLTRAQAEERFPGHTFSETAELDFEFRDGAVLFAYKTDATEGAGHLAGSEASKDSTRSPLPIGTWREFRDWAFQQSGLDAIYRGQSGSNRLRTAFHRTCRKNLARFRDDDISSLRRALAPRLKHVFNPMNPLETGALYYLAQHHGYPTPLLDWTQSPFVAAFFAFRAKPRERDPSECVRIFAFDRPAWESHMTPSPLTGYARPHFSAIDLLPIENQRALPQQATATITNVDDIEDFISSTERDLGAQFLQVIDLPLSERQEALTDLSIMGITAGSLFPGLDGACEALAAQNFGF